MKNTKANRTKFLQGYLKILLSWKEKEQDVSLMKKSLEELNETLSIKRKVVLYKNINDLGNDLRSDLWNDLGSDIRNNLWSDLGNNLRNITWEYYEFIWPVFVGHFYKNSPTIKRRIKTIQALDKCIKSGVGYLWLSSTTLYAIPFPKISIDSEKRLHNEQGPACEWNEKEKSYWFHGVKVNEKIIMHPEELMKKDWMDEKNTEIRRVMLDRKPSLINELGMKIQKDTCGELWKMELPDDPDKIAVFIHVQDTSHPDKWYFERVPPTIQTCREGVAWQFQLKEQEYKPVLQA